ncbi:MAG TPA: metal ABC transporter ATP-binding protein [Actinophytocola sp.]|uniref:metal ABC transporter ATP-binding protein n=1 Tax=Actinophytocola sp. TaxID=1872138 RepID=UPI002DBAD0ED|nr:metal ABC transporter ATP-binding protein [Actinophytocola sp.]HEU5471809.1 metal ABC transporter ATP-binding protein [Actinophytocola sp.]
MTVDPSTRTSPALRVSTPDTAGPVVRLRGATLGYGARVLWRDLDLDVRPGEFVAVLGPNGSGKTSLLRVLLGLQRLSAGTVEVAGAAPGRANQWIGYIPQQRALDPTVTMRGRDLVGLGWDGHRWGTGLSRIRERRRRVQAALVAVGALGYADRPVGLLSGGEQQRLRVAQAMTGDPRLLLCDEPLLSLDLANQQVVSRLIDERRRTAGSAVLFVTHEINPVLPLVDRVLYLVDGRFRIGPVEAVMTSETLSELYGTTVDVLRVRGQIHVVGAHSGLCEDHAPHHLGEA